MLGHRLLLLLQMLLIVMATSTSNVLADLPLPAATTLPQNESSYYLDGTGQASDAVLISEQDSYYKQLVVECRHSPHYGMLDDFNGFVDDLLKNMERTVKVGANKCERMHCAGAGNSAWFCNYATHGKTIALRSLYAAINDIYVTCFRSDKSNGAWGSIWNDGVHVLPTRKADSRVYIGKCLGGCSDHACDTPDESSGFCGGYDGDGCSVHN